MGSESAKEILKEIPDVLRDYLIDISSRLYVGTRIALGCYIYYKYLVPTGPGKNQVFNEIVNLNP